MEAIEIKKSSMNLERALHLPLVWINLGVGLNLTSHLILFI